MALTTPFQKEYSVGFVPAFDVTPKVGLAALDVTFTDESFEGEGFQKDYTGDVPVQKEYV